MNMYGTTLRVWDSSIHAWRIKWTNPAGNHHEEQIGRWSGKDVVQVGTRPNGIPTRWSFTGGITRGFERGKAGPNGIPTRWSFTEITPDSFHWLGEAMQPDGKTWKLEGEFRARRMR